MNWERTRSFFPVTRELAYLNHAGVAPISTRVEEALRRYAHEASHHGAWDYASAIDAEIERVRGRAALLLGAHGDEIAFMKNTSAGLGSVAAGLDWRRGDQVVTCDLEYPSNVYPWWALEDRGVETIMLRGRDGRLPFELVEDALRSPRVRMLALSSVEYGSGFRNDLEALGALCRERGALFCVDAIQSVGCLPMDVERCGIDFLAADGHKWMLAPEGCALLYCARRANDIVTPPILGWKSVTDPLNYDEYRRTLHPNALKFEEGSPSVPGVFALGAAIDLLLELGVDAIGQRVLALTDRLVDGLRARGARVLSPRGPGESSGIVSFLVRDEPPERTVQRLRDAKVFTVARRGGVRASPHFYNHEGDLARLLEAL